VDTVDILVFDGFTEGEWPVMSQVRVILGSKVIMKAEMILTRKESRETKKLWWTGELDTLYC